MNIYHKLKIGLDYHGVVDTRIEYFTLFAKEARKRGHQIYIITGGPKYLVQKKLDQHNFCYDHIFAIVDYFQAKDQVSYDANGNFHIAEDLWNKAKGEYCRIAGIDLQIDDSLEYAKWFKTPYCFYHQESKICILTDNQKINLFGNIQDTLDDIEEKFAVSSKY
ncbi:MAG: hypothetical protein E7019_06940 [Alphaproteobacteria bacterium]|nr:hypothetical protein [Alphaproteobacteria bacterium]